MVIAEPEPMEYVRVCDTYGVGFYYIPGTETCLKVSGYMRYDIGVGDALGINNALDRDSVFDGNPGFETDDTYFKRVRFALRVDSRAETELGTLRTYAQALGHEDQARLLGQTLDEETAADEKLTLLARSGINAEALQGALAAR